MRRQRRGSKGQSSQAQRSTEGQDDRDSQDGKVQTLPCTYGEIEAWRMEGYKVIQLVSSSKKECF